MLHTLDWRLLPGLPGALAGARGCLAVLVRGGARAPAQQQLALLGAPEDQYVARLELQRILQGCNSIP